jgi:hypothetical protein
MINWIKCKLKGHTLVHAGECPFTGSVYDVCTRCTAMIPRQVAV